MSNVNSYPVQEFIELVKLADLTKKQEIRLDIKTAKTLAFTLGELTAQLAQDLNSTPKAMIQQDIIEVRVDGGGIR